MQLDDMKSLYVNLAVGVGFIFLLGTLACNPKQKSESKAKDIEAKPQSENSPTPDPFVYNPQIPTDEPDCPPDQSAAITSQDGQRIGSQGSFPYVYQGMGRSNLFEAYTMRFQLCYDPLLVPMTNEQIPWINPDVYNENNGTFITYVRQGRDISISSPHVMVQYINKTLPYCGSPDSIYQWLDQQFLEDNESKVLVEEKVATALGKPALVREYYVGTLGGKRSERYIAYAYVDYNKDYIIGFAFTASISTDFPIGRPLFYKLVRSLNYY